MNFKKFSTSDNQWYDVPYYQHKTATDTLTLPAVLYPNDTTVTVGIKGQSSQNGTPTPDNPIMPQGCGDMTGNLFSCKIEQGTISAEGGLRSADNRVRSDDFIIMEAGEYTINALSESGALTLFLFEYMEDGTFVSRTPTDWTNVPYTFSLTGKCKMKFVFAYSSGNITPAMVNSIMLNSGSTALPYEPYGIKIPISCGGTTNNVYLGEVQTVRQIKKLVLTGDEKWQFYQDSSGAWQFYVGNMEVNGVVKSSALSNIAPYGANPETRHLYEYGCYLVNNGIGVAFQMKGAKDTFTNVDAWKSYLAAQYAAGTPVTVWYVLATPQTAIVNEPLMKIGSYSDSLTTSIPVTAGENTLDVQTTVAPSEVTATYEGWHTGTVHERENGAWT